MYVRVNGYTDSYWASGAAEASAAAAAAEVPKGGSLTAPRTGYRYMDRPRPGSARAELRPRRRIVTTTPHPSQTLA